MTIAIDCRMINSSGIGVYLRGILPFFLESTHQFFLLGNTNHLNTYSSYSNVTIFEYKIKPFSIKDIIFFPFYKLCRQVKQADIFYSPFISFPGGINIPVFATIHDMVFSDMPEITSRIGHIIRMWFFRRAYRKSRKIFTVSEFSKSRIECHLGKKKPIIITYSAILKMFFKYKENYPTVMKKEIIVFVGNIKKHKGINCLLDAFSEAIKEGLHYKLIIIGSKENFRTENDDILRKIDSYSPEEIQFTGFISDDNLMKCLAEAALIVQPSLYEGFGLPPLEAMILGTKALISDIPVFKEIYEDFPVTFFRSGDILDLKNNLLDLLLNKPVENIYLPKHLVEKYSFQKTADIILRNLTIKESEPQ